MATLHPKQFMSEFLLGLIACTRRTSLRSGLGLDWRYHSGLWPGSLHLLSLCSTTSWVWWYVILYGYSLLNVDPKQSALFASWFSFGLPGIFWLYLNRGIWFESPRKVLLTMLNVLCVCIGIILVSAWFLSFTFSRYSHMIQCGLGVYTSGKAIHDDPSSASFSCANNAW